MKQKYQLSKDDETNEIVLKEFAELDKDILSLLCEQRYDAAAMEQALGQGRDALFNILRTQNMYPPNHYMEKIADSVETFFGSDPGTPAEVYFDDAEYLITQQEEMDALANIEEEDDDLDGLLDDSDDLDDGLVASDDDISSISANTSIKIADDESLDIADDD